MTPFAESLLFVWRKNGKRAQDLFANIPDARMTEQSGGLTNHAAWCLSHLNLYHAAIVNLARGEAVADPAKAPDAEKYGNGSKPVTDPKVYLPRAELIARFTEGHAQVEAALADAACDVFKSEPNLERWKSFFGTGGAGLAYLMLYHETHHLAEIANWKKALGIPVVG
ncbi:MAG: DinB family protein [Candidatus Hydrogenedentes bacterium]|nr:DinB family protein [Candidatus Hydrogenedentota bacterium]